MKSNILVLFLIFIIVNMGCVVSYSFNEDKSQIKDIYVDLVKGNDVFKGDSVESPKRSIKGAICEFEKTNKLEDVKCVIHLSAGQYTGENNRGMCIKGNRVNKIVFIGMSPRETVIDAKGEDFVFNSKSSLEFYNLAIKNGDSKRSVVTAPVLYIENCYFIGNKGKYGGAVYHDNIVLTVYDSSFGGNRAGGCGGAIYTKGSQKNIAPTVVKYCFFNGNMAGEYGGAFYKESKNINLNIICCEFRNDKGKCGGAVFLNGPVFLNAHGSMFRCNHAVESGGAVYFKHGKWEDDDYCRPNLAENNTPQNFVFH